MSGIFGRHDDDDKPADVNEQRVADEMGAIFDATYRDELRKRGSDKFDALIEQGAMFLKQNMDLMVTEVGAQIKDAVDKRIETEFEGFSVAMKEAKDLALDTLKKTAADIEAERAKLAGELEKESAERKAAYEKEAAERQSTLAEEVAARQKAFEEEVAAHKAALIKDFETNMARIVEQYVTEAIGEQISVHTQLPHILRALDANKEAIRGDMQA